MEWESKSLLARDPVMIEKHAGSRRGTRRFLWSALEQVTWLTPSTIVQGQMKQNPSVPNICFHRGVTKDLCFIRIDFPALNRDSIQVMRSTQDKNADSANWHPYCGEIGRVVIIKNAISNILDVLVISGGLTPNCLRVCVKLPDMVLFLLVVHGGDM